MTKILFPVSRSLADEGLTCAQFSSHLLPETGKTLRGRKPEELSVGKPALVPTIVTKSRPPRVPSPAGPSRSSTVRWHAFPCAHFLNKSQLPNHQVRPRTKSTGTGDRQIGLRRSVVPGARLPLTPRSSTLSNHPPPSHHTQPRPGQGASGSYDGEDSFVATQKLLSAGWAGTYVPWDRYSGPEKHPAPTQVLNRPFLFLPRTTHGVEHREKN